MTSTIGIPIKLLNEAQVMRALFKTVTPLYFIFQLRKANKKTAS
jgi:hypothetical protein